MSGEQILITLETGDGAPSSFPVVLKKIMEMPPPNILDGDDGKSTKLMERKRRRRWWSKKPKKKRVQPIKKAETHEHIVFRKQQAVCAERDNMSARKPT